MNVFKKDFDCTGRYHKQYAAKWLTYLNKSDVVLGIPLIPNGGMPNWAAHENAVRFHCFVICDFDSDLCRGTM
jgi:hypothetical protein